MSIPADLRYTKEHEWARKEADGTITVGITHHAQDALGDVVYVELPAAGDALDAGAAFGAVESVKSVSDLFAPLAGEIVAVNQNLEDLPELINAEPYGQGWIVRLAPNNAADFDALLDAEAYGALLEAEAH
jgi:glycine cleavage system H protein